MATHARDAAGHRHELVNAVTTLRLLVDGWQDGILDARPGTAGGTALRAQARAVSELVEELSRLRQAG